MAADLLACSLVAYLLTYLIHSTLLLAGAWSLETVCEFESVRLRERLWRAALLGGFLTAAVQLGLGLQPPLARWVLRPEPGVARAEERAQARSAPAWPGSVEEGGAVQPAAGPAGSDRHRPAGVGRSSRPPAPGPEEVPARALPGAPVAAPPPAALGAPDAERWALDGGRWVPLLAAGFSALALGALALLALAAARLRGRLRGAVELREGPEVEYVAELRRRSRCEHPVRLLVAPALCSPLTSGLLRPVICVPPRALAELSRTEREAMLAHELGHVARRDPAWLTAYWLIGRLCFFQPLNLLARRRLAVCAEWLADDWAVRHTGRQVPLASCLARIAAWITERPRLLTAHMTPGLAATGRARSQLGKRIERLLDDRLRTDEPLRRWWSPAALGLFAALALVAPGVAAREARPDAAPEPSPRTRAEAEVGLATVEPEVVRPEPAPAPDGAPDASLEEELAALDGEVALLEQELELLRGDLALLASDPSVSQALAALEAHARALSARRDRMHSLLRAPVPTGIRP